MRKGETVRRSVSTRHSTQENSWWRVHRGKTFLIERQNLVLNLELSSRGEEFLFELRQKDRLSTELEHR